MGCHTKKVIIVMSINVFFSIMFLIHFSSIGYRYRYSTLNPEVPEIIVYKKNLNEIEFPMTFRICAYELNDAASRYQLFGYQSHWDFFQGKSMFNDTLYGWAGHDKNGSVLGNVEGEIFSNEIYLQA